MNHIRHYRYLTRQMTQQQLAQRTGVTRQTIVAVEGGKYAPSLELAFKIAVALEQPIEAVFEYEVLSP